VPTPGTQRVAIRIEPDLWDAFGELAQQDRSKVLREFIRWYTRHADAPKKLSRPDFIATAPDGTVVEVQVKDHRDKPADS
jgi:metal-responsive CopG/Arc/MetJ family transcriptional regulator